MSSLTPGAATVAFVTGIYSPEDLARIPGTGWLVTTGMAGPENQGHLYAVEIDRMEATEIYPAGAERRLDSETYGDVDPPDLGDFSAVGIALRGGDAGVHTVYVVNHGGRSAVEAFEIDATRDPPGRRVGRGHLPRQGRPGQRRRAAARRRHRGDELHEPRGS